MLPLIAAAYEVDIVADAYFEQRTALTIRTAPQGAPLYETLARVTRPGEVTRSGDFLRIRDYRWYQRRSDEPPLRLVREIADGMKRTRRVTLEQVAEWAERLRQPQLAGLPAILLDFGIRWEAMLAFNAREYATLRVWNALTARQRESLQAGRPIPYDGLSPEGRLWLSSAHHERRSGAETAAALPVGGGPGGVLIAETDLIHRTVAELNGDKFAVYTPANAARNGKYGWSTMLDPTRSLPEEFAGGQTTTQLFLTHWLDPQRKEEFVATVPMVFVDRNRKEAGGGRTAK